MLKAFNPSHHILKIHATETILWLGNAYALHNPTNAILNRANILKWCLLSMWSLILPLHGKSRRSWPEILFTLLDPNGALAPEDLDPAEQGTRLMCSIKHETSLLQLRSCTPNKMEVTDINMQSCTPTQAAVKHYQIQLRLASRRPQGS